MEKEILYKIKKRLERLGERNIGETQTKESFINPVISALGWDVSDFDEVRLEYKHTKKDNPVDYALLIDMNPKLFIEAKQLGLNIDDRKWIGQTLTYATMAGVKWALLTDGNHYKLYNTMAEARVEEKQFFEWKMKEVTDENIDKILYFLSLLTKEKFKDDAIEQAWQNHFEVNKIRNTLIKLINDKDDSLLNLLRKRTRFSRTTIVNSLNKLKIRVDRAPLHAISDFKPEIKRSSFKYTGRIPEKIRLFNKIHHVKYWKEILIIVAEELIKRNPEKFSNIADSEAMQGESRIWLSKYKEKVYKPHELSDGLYIDLNLSAKSIMRNINRFLMGCGYKESEIEIFLKE